MRSVLLKYNNSYHRFIKMTPIEVSQKMKQIVYNALFPE